jgi:ferredoxin-NADP reductase
LESLVFREELSALAAQRGIDVHYLVGPRGSSWLPVGYEPRSLLPDLAAWDVFVCGPDAWMTEVASSLLTMGLPAGRLHQERFTW